MCLKKFIMVAVVLNKLFSKPMSTPDYLSKFLTHFVKLVLIKIKTGKFLCQQSLEYSMQYHFL